jgi:hypothetical protein
MQQALFFQQKGYFKLKEQCYTNGVKDEYNKLEVYRVKPNEKLKEQLSIYYAIYEIYANVIHKRTTRNIQMEFDDAISAFMSAPLSERNSPANLAQLRKTITKHFGKVKVFSPLTRKVDIPDNQDVVVYDIDGVLQIEFEYNSVEKMILSYYSDRLKFLLRDIEIEPALLIILTYFNMRSHSGSNWSPVESYPDLFEMKGSCIIMECFASLFNNQNFLNSCNVVDYIFTLNECDRVMPYVAGTWPTDTKKVVAGIDPSMKILLLVNPVYTEDIIVSSIESLYEIWKAYPGRIAARMTLPLWDDLYVGELRKKMDEMGLVWTKYTESRIRNFTQKGLVPLKFYQLSSPFAQQ